MKTIDEVLSAVDAAFDAIGAPSWPDPHPDRTVLEEEYSRVTDPQRYRALTLRLDAWREVLGGAGVTVETLGSQPRRERWTSELPGTLAVEVSIVDIDQVPVVGLSVGGDPFDVVPDCACDACDSGSADLLGVLDADLASLVEGDLVVARGAEGQFELVGRGEGWSLIGDLTAEPAEVVDAIRSGDDPHLPAGTTVLHGSPWLP
ncbi:DUF6226 family protein [Acidipropionibacterium timonense]|uniref:DUF6226 family protein n=1 Tax=Acidipropionibacterium timonense TaxID=2161818 RepID=UPI00102F60B1|nr:DUF6226 family protein [Acidipropionibacterium timonense]